MNRETRQALEKMKCIVITSEDFFKEGHENYLSFCINAKMTDLDILSAYLVIGQGKISGKNTKLKNALKLTGSIIWTKGQEVVLANARDVYKWAVLLPRP